jgi:hypothetical protein
MQDQFKKERAERVDEPEEEVEKVSLLPQLEPSLL